MTTKEFLTVDVMSAASGFLLTDEGMGPIYRVLSFVTGEDVYTHQLPRVGKELQAALLSDRPDLEDVFDLIRTKTTRETWRDVAAEIEQKLGLSMTLRRLSHDEHERIDPLSELAEKVHPDRIIPIEVTRK